MATSEGIPSSIDIEFLELNDNPYVCSSPQNGVIKGLSLSMFAHLQLFVIIRSVENSKHL